MREKERSQFDGVRRQAVLLLQVAVVDGHGKVAQTMSHLRAGRLAASAGELHELLVEGTRPRASRERQDLGGCVVMKFSSPDSVTDSLTDSASVFN